MDFKEGPFGKWTLELCTKLRGIEFNFISALLFQKHTNLSQRKIHFRNPRNPPPKVEDF